MMISLLPAVSATADISEGITIKYDLSSHLAELGLTSALTQLENPAETTPKPADINALTHGLFKFSGATSRTSGWSKTFYAIGANSISSAHNIVFRHYVSFEVSVPVSGTYTMKVDHGTHTSGGDVTVYITEGDLTRGMHKEQGTALGTYSAYIDSTAASNLKNYKKLTTSEVLTSSGNKGSYAFEAGKKYTVTFDGPTSTYYGSVGSFSLIAGDGAIPIDVEISGEEALDLDATVYLSDGTTGNDVTWTMKAGDEAKATIDADGKITVLADGTVEITATAEVGGVSVSKTVSVAVTAAPDTGDDNTGDDNTGDDNTGDDNTGDDNTGDDNTGDDNTGDDNTGDDNTGDDNTGDDNTGDDNTGDDNTGDVEDIVLSDVKLVYDIASYVGAKNDTSVPFSSFDYAKTKNLWEYAANRRGSYSWASGLDTVTTSGEYLNYQSGRGVQIRVGNNWWAIKINVPESGYYIPKAYYGTYQNGGYNVYMNYYTIPVTDEGVSVVLAGSAFATAENLVGSVNCTDKNAKDVTMRAEPEEFEARYFAKGEHYIIFLPTCTDEGASGTLRGIVSKFELDGGDKTMPMDIEISGEDTLDLDATVYLSDGTTAKNVTYKSGNEEIAEIDESGVITVFKDAAVDITVTAENDGFSLSKTFNVNVKEPEIPGVSVTYDIVSRIGTRNNPSVKFTDFTYESNNNLWEYAANRRLSYSWTSGLDTITTSGEHLNYISGKGIGIRVASNWWAIKIRVPESGLYVPKVTCVTYANASGKVDGVAEVVDVYMHYYLIPVTEEVGEDGVIPELRGSNFVGGEHLIGSVNGTGEKDVEVKQEALQKRNIPAGEYYFVYYPAYADSLAGKTVSGTHRAGAANLTLDGRNCIQEVEISADTYDLSYDKPGEGTAKINVKARRLNGSVFDNNELDITYNSSNTNIAEVSSSGVVTPVGDGEVDVTVTVSDGVETVSKTLTFNAFDNTGVDYTKINLSDKMYVGETVLLSWKAFMNSGNIITVDFNDDDVTIEPINGEDGIEFKDGVLTATKEGTFRITVKKDFRGTSLEESKEITVVKDAGKTAPTLYTNEMRENMRENIAKYDWAKNTQKNAGKAAEKLLPAVDVFLDQIYGEGIPRTIQIGVRGDEYTYFCRYCHERVYRGFKLSYTSRPWKIQCSYCKRLFPSNDFEGFLELGLDESGLYFDVARAREAHHKMLFHKDGSECTCEKPATANTPEWYIFYGYGNPEGYLYNELYGEIRESNTDPWGELITWNDENGGADLGTYTDENGKVLWQGGDMWGVDDGWGYLPGRKYADGLEERHGYVAFYNNAFWGNLYETVLTLAEGYLYTEDVKYGRAGALLLDRVANVLPSFDMYSFRNKFLNSHGGSGYGAVQGRINDSYVLRELIKSADILYPMIQDEQLIGELSADAEARGLENDKTSPEKVWQNWEEGIVLAGYEMVKDGRIAGNFGQAQGVAGLAAIVVGKQPETNEILNWIYATDEGDGKTKITGGALESTLINRVDRDGMGDEASPRYNTSWVSNLSTFADAVAKYTGEGDYQPFSNPKFIKMYTPQIDMLLLDSKHPNVGDSGSVASVTRNGSSGLWFQAFSVIENEEYKKKIANYLYTVNGNKTDGYRYDIFTKNPEGAEEEIMKYVDTVRKQESTILTGYGIAILRDGAKHDSANAATAKNTMRDIWVYFGRNSGHGHQDTLNLGMDAYGLDIAPELGYPEATSYTPNRLQWVEPTISHNTVVINEGNHDKTIKHGYPLHFDDTETVKLIDVDASNVNSNAEKYRRTVVMIKASDDVSYGVDFFRVTGGNTHTYSFHSQAENAYPISGLELTKQVDENGEYIGTYAGVDGKDPETGEWIEYGPDPYTENNYNYSTKYPRGYTWMNKVRRDKSPEQNISVEFDVQDYNKVLADGKGIKLRLTQMNSFTPDEVAIVGGYVPIKSETKSLPRTLDYMLVHRRGENLDSLFTTVLEPYKGERYVNDIKAVDISVKTGDENSDDMARAVKVAHTSGRVDYVVYATNNDVVYTVTDGDLSFDFRGFVGVYTVNENGACIYRYVNDGTVIGDETEKTAAYTGTVTGFQKGHEIENYIDVEMQCDDLSDLAGRVIYVDNDRVENGAYRILSASTEGEGLKEGSIRLDIGTVTLIRSHVDKFDFDKGYVYNIKEEQTFTIPTSFEDEGLPVFEPVSDTLSTSAGSSISVMVKAKSPITTDTPTITYIGTTLPRGASLNSETGVLTWKPDDSQVGDNHVAITARDSDGREATIHFNIAVYGSTTGGSSSDKTETPEAGTTTPSGGGGGGGGGGGAAPETPETSDKKDNGETDTSETSGESGEDEKNEGNTDNTGTANNSLRFTDLAEHSWAQDAIGELAADGIIKGTSASTFAPANNITRADFALLLVRAFKLESDNAENFADVDVSDYFASELAIARNTGIINGIGDNKFAPRNTITRQDMMVIVYRALTALGVGFGIYDEPQYPDYSTVADYAKEAVSALIGAGLVNGKSGNIAPTDYTTRAEVAVLIKRILDFTK